MSETENNSVFMFPLVFAGAVIVVMGVSGAGKTNLQESLNNSILVSPFSLTIGRRLEKEMKCKYLDADDFHSESNKEKMRMGIPLTDEDRMPWLESLRDAIKEYLNNKKGVIIGCSALKKQYREVLRSGDPGYKLGSYASAVNFILLDVPAEVLSVRVKERAAEGKHYMPASLLQSQLDLLLIDESEGIHRVDATLRPQVIVHTILNMHQFQGCIQSSFVEPH
ncbi:idnK, partial [Mucuna pruriens]